MKYSLRSLIIVAILMPPLLAMSWQSYLYLSPSEMEGFNGKANLGPVLSLNDGKKVTEQSLRREIKRIFGMAP